MEFLIVIVKGEQLSEHEKNGEYPIHNQYEK